MIEPRKTPSIHCNLKTATAVTAAALRVTATAAAVVAVAIWAVVAVAADPAAAAAPKVLTLKQRPEQLHISTGLPLYPSIC